ncbi:HipA N-terminal domain-containing protein [Runella sp.]|uniref:HipA N-terminal domain-containing protein n=1 Tax=Runella sp. TaxID=1960881 RepID=UPI002623E869|nr:HipA N-terminal domain-containing protein [Runella sp.]
MSRSGQVFYQDNLAGIITENEDGYFFQYDERYLKLPNAQAISFIMPLQKQVFSSNTLFPFFDGLIPEGWLLAIASDNWKINLRDRMGLLLAVCGDCIGAVSIQPIIDENHE